MSLSPQKPNDTRAAPDRPGERAALVEELVGALTRFDDPTAAWSEVRAAVDRSLAAKAVEHGREVCGQSAEGAATTGADQPPTERRRYAGFERESATYARLKTELLATAEGKYVVIVGDEMVGPENGYGNALRAGYRRFGPGPLYVKQVLAEEPVDEIPGDVIPCRP